MPKTKKKRPSFASDAGVDDRSSSVAGPSNPARHDGRVSTISGFTVLPVGPHHLFCRRHTGAQSQQRTLFVANLPSDATDAHLRVIFHRAGRIERVEWLDSADATGRDEQDEDEAEEKASDTDSDLSAGRESAAAAASSAGTMGGGTQRWRQGRAMGRGGRAKARDGPPDVVPLPPLDPRPAGRRLRSHTCASARVVFLEPSSVDKALRLAPQTAWPDPWAQLRRATGDGAVEGVVAGADLGEAQGKRKRPPTTAAEAALAAVDSQLEARPPVVGLAYLVQRHAALRPPLEAVRLYADSVVNRYAWLREHPEKARRLDIQAGGPGLANLGGIEAVSTGENGELLDADGFTIVTRGGKYGRTTDASAGSAAAGASVRVARAGIRYDAGATARDGAAKRKRPTEMEDFYRFQRREKKREDLAQLRAKFEQDKAKVAKLRQQRRFAPF